MYDTEFPLGVVLFPRALQNKGAIRQGVKWMQNGLVKPLSTLNNAAGY